MKPDTPRALSTPTPIPNGARVLAADGDSIGGIVIFLEGGQLSLLDIYDHLDTCGISPLPPVDRVRYERRFQC